MTERQHPQTADEMADQVLRYLARHKKVLWHGKRSVRSVVFTVKFRPNSSDVRQRFWTIESEPNHPALTGS